MFTSHCHRLMNCSLHLVGFLDVGVKILTLDGEFALCVLQRLNNGCNLAVRICDHLIDCSMRLVGFLEVGVANLSYMRDLHSGAFLWQLNNSCNSHCDHLIDCSMHLIGFFRSRRGNS